MWPSRAASTLQPETLRKGRSLLAGCFQPRQTRNSPRRCKAGAATPPPSLPGEGGEQPHVSRSPTEKQWGGAGRGWGGRRRARRRPGSARPALPSLRGPPARQPSQGCPRGPLAGMTAPEGPTRAHLPEDSYGRGPRGDPAHRAPQIRGQTAEGALPPGGNWTLNSSPPSPHKGQAGSSTIRKLSRPPFPALPAKEP